MEGYGPSTYGDGFADVYDDWYADVTDAGARRGPRRPAWRPARARCSSSASAAGGSRCRSPHGLEVWGIDASPAMVERLRAKPGGDAHPCRDRRHGRPRPRRCPTATTPGSRVVFVAYQHVLQPDATTPTQRRCLAARAPRCSRPAACSCSRRSSPTSTRRRTSVEAARSRPTRSCSTSSRTTRSEQTRHGQHVEITEAGIRLRPWSSATPGPSSSTPWPPPPGSAASSGGATGRARRSPTATPSTCRSTAR